MSKYFIDAAGMCIGECLVDTPTNPFGHTIVEHDTLDDPFSHQWVDGAFVRLTPAVQKVTPQSVTRYQGRAALLQMGLLDDIDAHYAALPTDTADEALNLKNRLAKERWAGMLNFERDSAELVELASAFGLSATQVDDLFCFAETIK